MASAALDAARASHGRCGRRKDAGALLGTCAPLAAEAKKREDEESKLGGTKRTGPPLQELLLQLQAHMVGDDAAAQKKLRGECQPDQRKRCLVLTHATAVPARGARLTDSPPRAPRDRGPLRAVVRGGAPAVDPRALGVHQGGVPRGLARRGRRARAGGW